MPDIFLLDGNSPRPAIDEPELAHAIVRDGAAPATQLALDRLHELRPVWELDRDVLDLLDTRLHEAPAPAQPVSLRDLVQSARERLERERLGSSRTLTD